MPITQDRFLSFIRAADGICVAYAEVGKSLRGSHTILARAEHNLSLVHDPETRQIILDLCGALRTAYDTHAEVHDTYAELVAVIKDEKVHFQRNAIRNDRWRARQKRMRDIARAKHEGTHIPQFFTEESHETFALEAREEPSPDWERLPYIPGHYDKSMPDALPGETPAQYAKRISGTNKTSEPSVSVTEAKPPQDQPPPTKAEIRGNDKFNEDLTKPDFAPGENIL